MKIFVVLMVSALIMGAPVYLEAEGAEYIVIRGVGYPPVRAGSKAQAKLMARRAAMLDAYRNALKYSAKNDITDDDSTYFQQLSGFVRAMQMLQEEYLSDGGIRITARVKTDAIYVHSESQVSLPDASRTGQRQASGPGTVSQMEWKQIIEKMVKIDPKPVSEGEQ